jgi:LysM repeat protein
MEKVRRKTYLDNTEESNSLLNNDFIQMDYVNTKKDEDLSPGPRTPRDQTIECDIQPNDTLSNLALKYNLPLAELKRVNNIMKDSEFYALKRIKIPVKPSSFLRELIPGVHSETNRRENGWYVESKEIGASSNLSSSLVSSGYSSPCSELDSSTYKQENRDKKKVKRFLKDMDKDLERIKDRQSNQNSLENVNNCEDSDTGLEDKDRIQVMYTNFDKQGDDGVSNGSLICWCFLIVLLVLSLLVILAALMHVDHHHTDIGVTGDESEVVHSNSEQFKSPVISKDNSFQN